jgi:ATP-binding cassette subfamily F protein 3
VIVQFNKVSKSFGSENVLRDVSFQINPSEKIGLIGANGAGKTTILKLIVGVYEPEAGSITRKSGLRTGTLDQIAELESESSVLEEALRSSDHLRALEREMRELEHSIASGDRHILERYSYVQHEFELKGGYSYLARTQAALFGVGFSNEAFHRPCRTLSGGEKNRLALARILLSNPDLLLLDEPTNHLDIRSVEWLEKFLRETNQTLLVVSHDRVFLDRVVNRIIEVGDATVLDYRGNYSSYINQRAARLAQQKKQWELQNEWIEAQQEYIRRNIAGQKTKQAQSRRKLLARIKPIEKPKAATATVSFRFTPVGRVVRYVLRARGLAIGFEDTPLVKSIDLEVERGERWAILGPNGAGKTTLLRTLVGARAPVSGELEWNDSLEVGYYDQQLQDLDPDATVLDEIRAIDLTASDGELRAYLALFLFSGDDVYKKVMQLSGGEKSRLTLARIIYAGPQLLALDEPTNHLDIRSREALETALAEYGGTILFVTHDRYLVQKIATHLIYIDGDRSVVFDRLSAFEEWVTEPKASEVVRASDEHLSDIYESNSSPRHGRLSKNKREQLEREAAQIEMQIASVESEIAELELRFQNPITGTDWETTHKRYANLKLTLDSLYKDLASRWELMG